MPSRFSRIVAITLVMVGGGMLYAVATNRLSILTTATWTPQPAAVDATARPTRTLAALTPAPADGPQPAHTPTIAVPDPKIVDDTAIDPAAAAPSPAAAPTTVVAALRPPGAADTARPAVPAKPEPEAKAPEEPEPEEPVEVAAPVLDLVRVTRDGSTVVSGSALPGAKVELMIDGITVGTAIADRRGSFAIVTEIGPLLVPRALQVRTPRPPALVALDPERTQTEAPGAPEAPETGLEDLLPAVSGNSTAVAAIAAPDAAQAPGDPGFAAVAVALSGGPAPEPPEPRRGAWLISAPVVILPPEGPRIAHGEGAAPALVEADPDGLTLKTPAAAPVERMVLDAVTYNAAGDAVARGRAPAGARIRIFVNNRALAETTAPESGDWIARLPEEKAQIARVLRFDEIGPGGEVIHRLETRFDYAREVGDLTVNQRSIIVERGDSLWRIAENIYGDGFRYSVIFGANAGLIRDPDLIYPEQEFVIPELSPAAPQTDGAGREGGISGVAGGD